MPLSSIWLRYATVFPFFTKKKVQTEVGAINNNEHKQAHDQTKENVISLLSRKPNVTLGLFKREQEKFSQSERLLSPTVKFYKKDKQKNIGLARDAHFFGFINGRGEEYGRRTFLK